MTDTNAMGPENKDDHDHFPWTDDDANDAQGLLVAQCARALGVSPELLLDAVQRGQLGEWPDEESGKRVADREADGQG